MYIETIKKRHSVRTFEKEALSSEKIGQINSILETKIETPFNTECRFVFLKNDENSKDMLNGLGTYGTMKNPSGFIVGLVSINKSNLIDFGYAFEKIILDLTNIGVATCWLGGTFTKSSFFKKANGKSDEVVPCIIAIGKEASKMSLTDRAIRTMAKSHKRKSWDEIFKINTSSLEENYKTALEMLRLSPSASNKQPWEIHINQNEFIFYLKRNNSYNKMINFLKLSDLQMVDMGICMSHFELSLNEKNITGSWIEPVNSKDIGLVAIFKIN